MSDLEFELSILRPRKGDVLVLSGSYHHGIIEAIGAYIEKPGARLLILNENQRIELIPKARLTELLK
jgi:hypothetical protein